ncbi:unnamed protein product [Phyllotreta striolata]|uniref:Uncharacterized protein n=1 Tax=Phyllotreta striolata TaxID=444603 RepID=A0A9N9XJZ5_PHYSR|nr:unnamed protein product [Phyllotreta striolata]
MKCVRFSLFLISVCCLQLAELLTVEQIKLLDERRGACLQETGVDSTVLERARKRDFVDDQKLKEHILCVAMKHQFVKDGELQQQQIIKKVGLFLEDEGLASKLYAKCSKDQGNILDTVFFTAQCFLKTAPIPII